MTTSPGIRVLSVPSDASERDLKVYFSNPRHGGSKVVKIYYPLQGNDAVVLFEDGKVNPKIFKQDHILRGKSIMIRSLQRQVFSKVTVELGPEITTLLDNDPKYLDDIQYDGELEVTSDDNYTISGDWYQIEWAWQYLDDVCRKRDDTVVTSNDDTVVTSNGMENNYLETKHLNSESAKSDSNKVNLPPLKYPHDNETLQASGFQPYYYGNWNDQSDRSEFFEDKSEENRIDPFEDFLSGGLGTDTTFPWMPQSFNSRTKQTGFTVSHQDFQDLPLTFDFSITSLKVTVLMNDLLKEKSDAIVSSAIGDLSAQFGISRVIARAADPKLREECREYIDRHGPLCIGDVMHTSAGGSIDKKVGFVIHAVGPTWRESRSEESTHLLTCTYLNILQYASSHMWLQNISMPLIGAGGVGFPLDVCVQAFYDALLIFVLDEENLNHLQEVRLVCNDEDSTCATIVVLRSLLDVDQISTQDAAKDRYIRRANKFSFKAKNLCLDDYLVTDKQDTSSFEKEDDKTSKPGIDSENQSSESKKSSPPDCDEKLISLSTKDSSVIFARSTASEPESESVTTPLLKCADFAPITESPTKRTYSSSSDESIPFGMIDSDEEQTVLPTTQHTKWDEKPVVYTKTLSLESYDDVQSHKINKDRTVTSLQSDDDAERTASDLPKSSSCKEDGKSTYSKTEDEIDNAKSYDLDVHSERPEVMISETGDRKQKTEESSFILSDDDFSDAEKQSSGESESEEFKREKIDDIQDKSSYENSASKEKLTSIPALNRNDRPVLDDNRKQNGDTTTRDE